MAGCLGSPFDLQQSRFVCKGNCLLGWAGNLSCSRPSWARKNSLRLPGSCAGGVHAAGNAEGLGGRKPGISMGGVRAGRERSTLLYTSTNVSWEQLDSQGLVFGTPVQIDGQFYLCRCLKVGAEDGVPNEWDTALDEAGENNMVWNWTNQYFWGQETSKGWVSNRAIRGWSSARRWNDYSASRRYAALGFRPALEPLGSDPCSPETLIGKTILLYGPRGVSLEGRLQDVDDYDFVLAPVAGVPTDCFWISKAGDNLVVSRDSVLWAKEA